MFLPETQKKRDFDELPARVTGALAIGKEYVRGLLFQMTYDEAAQLLSDEIGEVVSKGAVYKFAHDADYDPVATHLRMAFLLPPLVQVPVPPGKAVRVVTPSPEDTEYRPRCGHPTAEQREAINAMSPDERLAKLLE